MKWSTTLQFKYYGIRRVEADLLTSIRRDEYITGYTYSLLFKYTGTTNLGLKY